MTTSPLIVTGSWEDRLRQALRMVDNYDEKAAPALRVIVDRLNRMSPAQLSAGGFYLYQVRQKAASALERYHLRAGELAEATEVRRELLSWFEDIDVEEDQPAHERLLAMLTLQGRYDEAMAYAHHLIAQGFDATENLTIIALMAIRREDAQPVDAIISEIERDANRERNPDSARIKRVSLALCRTRLCLLRRQWAEAAAWFDHTCALDPSKRTEVAFLYDSMVRGGESERALTFTDQDTKYPLRAAFWRGLALRALGKEDACYAVWKNTLSLDMSKFKSNPGIFEWVLCHYYLGGELAALGYGLSLQFARADPDTPWFSHCIAGLGAALRGESTGAFMQMNVALEKMRIDLFNVHFGQDVRFHFENLLTAEQMAPLLHYFQPAQSSPGSVNGSASTE